MVTYKSILLAKIRKFLTEEVALKIYKSMILPYFDYGDILYGNANQDGFLNLQRLQNKCLKICKGFGGRFGTDELHHITKVPKLEARRKAHVNNFMYGRLTRLHLLNNRTRAHDAPLFTVKVPRVEAYKREVEFYGSVQWNSLPADIRKIDNLMSFKSGQKDVIK